ncbi:MULTISPECIES: methyltransferase domain-containing protein [Roseivirga]|jgi:SAM-dependent methyltransferase|uniref:methyltransferase domain-containing protein n=1 Tax=Roseivirga TaxID=290180 RepID=UPI001B0A7B38|nr:MULTISPECIES: methyltransferase domain-containing protein [Roseivirga]MBO6494016.1 methyltransferase domain-containing protein [Roseivirga sp.]MCO6359840.1 methyltransferase domain-containing protein [Roseivirga pacifica]MCO6367210.1 methyltransferase domain-containing protein [Roseivirga pacifica]MCO6370258.1 methyltransferase domain-containing protein [Roseivirga pacifica]MCO6374867.1 methyltransferase domain-containing protein [Roseivirga pacifica]
MKDSVTIDDLIKKETNSIKGIEENLITLNGRDFSIFENDYISLRRKEGRILTNSKVSKLPSVPKDDPHYSEWKLREKSTNRFLSYLKKRNSEGPILDLGCGNGWFTNKLSEHKTGVVIGMDINLSELKQASATFTKNSLTFCYGDILDQPFKKNTFDIITLNASVQYFDDFQQLTNYLISLLRDNGELHILDSPFYNSKNVVAAKNRTFRYYSSIGFESFAENYQHRKWSELKAFNYKLLYSPKVWNRIVPDSPFPWIVIYR